MTSGTGGSTPLGAATRRDDGRPRTSAVRPGAGGPLALPGHDGGEREGEARAVRPPATADRADPGRAHSPRGPSLPTVTGKVALSRRVRHPASPRWRSAGPPSSGGARGPTRQRPVARPLLGPRGL